MANWTDEQLRALDARGTNILLSAAAGSGKTTVLVERVLRLIENDDARIDRMLIVTFSRAASADMRRKLAEKLGKRAAEGSEKCRKAQPLLERASISTLHSFCGEFLRGNFESAGVDPAFRVLDEAETGRIAEQALDEALEEAYAAGGEALKALTFGRRTVGVRELTAALVRFLDDRDDPRAWLERFCSVDGTYFERLTGELRERLTKDLRRAERLYRTVVDHPDCGPNYRAPAQADLEAIGDILASEDFDAMLLKLGDFKAAPAGRSRSDPTTEAVKAVVKEARKLVAENPLRGVRLRDAFEDLTSLAPQLECLGALALRAREIGCAKRAELSALSYNDLEHFTIDALRDEATAQTLREQYDYIFVDEYQDTSDLQEALISRITRGGDLFMVGDVKQSIYGFRNAEPGIFRAKYDAYREHRGGELLPLTRNFRSRPGILELVNRTFELAMHGGDSEILYDELARLNLGDESLTGGGGELHILALPDTGEKENDERRECERQAGFIARRILEMKREDPSLCWRDFAILTRTRANLLGPMADVLASHGIPAYADDAAAYYETREITLAVSLLKLIVDRRCDYELIGLLRSPLVGLTMNDLAKIRVAHRAGTMADAVYAYARGAEVEEHIARKISELCAKLDRYELLSHCLELGVLCRTAFNDIGLTDLACALPGGELRQANLDRLCDNAAAYDRDLSGSLSRFIDHVEKLKKSGANEETHTLGENDDVVRLMTAHKSKGLEFPVVFGAMLQRSFARGGRPQPMSAHRELGFGFDLYDPALRSRRGTILQSAVRARKKREEYAEELRVLYVLMTRAKDKLILVGSAKDPEGLLEESLRLFEDPDCAKSDLELLCCALGDGADGLCPVSCHPYEAAFETPETEEKEETAEVEPDRELEALIRWRYPDEAAARMPLKLTVTGLLRELQSPDKIDLPVRRPAFLSESAGKMSGAEQGTAFHRLMQCLNFAPLRGLTMADMSAEIARQSDALLEKNRITQAQHDVVPAQALARFLSGPLGTRLLHAEEVRREWPFNVMMRVNEALTAEEAGEAGEREILVQGTPDCCFVEDGKWVLLDYKTDRTNDAEALTERYGDQLRMYALALERVTGMEVGEIELCLLRTGETIPITRK